MSAVAAEKENRITVGKDFHIAEARVKVEEDYGYDYKVEPRNFLFGGFCAAFLVGYPSMG